MLSRKCVRENTDCRELDFELTRNIGEELGSESNGKSHYDILADEVSASLGLELSNVTLSGATNNFISGIQQILSHEDPAYVLGATYALEKTAVPELGIVYAAVKKIAHDEKVKLTDMLNTFFEVHMNTWEPEHEKELRYACSLYITKKYERIQFEKGFKDVMKTMDSWWQGLYEEASRI